MTDLANPPENPCFGCGPLHPRGLHLRFREELASDGVREVAGEFSPKPDEVGWPTLFHHGLHFMVLYEASYWAALTLAGKLWVSEGTISYTTERLPRVGVVHSVRARVVRRTDSTLSVVARTSSAAGRPCGTLESDWRPAKRNLIERAGIPLPQYLVDELGD
jgi:hypothetical protein